MSSVTLNIRHSIFDQFKQQSRKMKFIVACLVATVAVVSAFPDASLLNPRLLPAIKHEEVRDESGQYAIRYATAEGTIVSEQGRLVPTADGKGRVLVQEGEYSWVGPDGKTYRTTYTSGLDGFIAKGDHLPVA